MKSMEVQKVLVALSIFLVAFGAGFGTNQILSEGSDKYTSQTSLEVNSDKQVNSTRFDGNFLELRYEDTPEAKFYFNFNDTRGVQRINGLKHDDKLQTTRKIRSFGNKTYFLYLRYRDNGNKTDDGFMRLYRVEET